MKKTWNNILDKIGTKTVIITALVLMTLVLLPTDVFAGKDFENISPEAMEASYNRSCFGCKVLQILLSSFMTAAAKTYNITSGIGSALLKIITPLTIAFIIIDKVRSFDKVEPADILSSVAILLFKVGLAFIVLNAGIGVLVSYFVTPLINAGLDFGNALLANKETFSNPPVPYSGDTSVVAASTLNKLLAFVGNAENKVKNSMIIGNAIMKFAITDGLWVDFGLIKIPDFFKLLIGFFLWLVGLLISLSVSYYLLDIAVTLAMVIIFLPIAIGVWPFNITKGKIETCVSAIINVAGLFAFLSIIASVGLALIESAFNQAVGTNNGSADLIKYIKNGDEGKVDDILSIWSVGVLMIFACTIYAYKLFQTAKEQNDNFFGGNLGLGDAMHEMAAKGAEFVTKMAKSNLSKAGSKIKEKIKDTKAYQNAKKYVKSKKAEVVHWAHNNKVARGLQSAHHFVEEKAVQLRSDFMNNTKIGRFSHKVGSKVRQVKDDAKFAISAKLDPIVEKHQTARLRRAEKRQIRASIFHQKTYNAIANVNQGLRKLFGGKTEPRIPRDHDWE